MCGIVAEHGGSDPEALERMLERLAHRGPDDRGTVQVDGSWLGHRRLSIVDVGGGRQPLSTRDESAYLVGNGEVYNHEEVRAGLVDRELLTTSDNEVALHLIDERGVEGLGELSGMFAFVMAGRDGRFVAARDPVGIKPLYWARRDGAVRFASEMHAFDPEWQSFVEPFPPGCAWTPERDDALRLRMTDVATRARERLLRESFEGWLPDEFLWRTKAEFGDAAGPATRSAAPSRTRSRTPSSRPSATRSSRAAHEGGARLLPRMARAPAGHQRRAHPLALRPRLTRPVRFAP